MERIGTPCYLVYYHRGEIKVKHGLYNRVFFPDNEYAWHSKVPHQFNVVSSRGKIIVRNAEDVPRAKEAVYQHYLNKIDDINNKAIASLSNIAKMIEGGEHGRKADVKRD